jgi:hypothetical protein
VTIGVVGTLRDVAVVDCCMRIPTICTCKSLSTTTQCAHAAVHKVGNKLYLMHFQSTSMSCCFEIRYLEEVSVMCLLLISRQFTAEVMQCFYTHSIDL